MIQNINLQVYEMRKNGYTFAEIADALGYSDEDIRNIDDVNQANLDTLSGLYDGTLTFSDINQEDKLFPELNNLIEKNRGLFNYDW